MKSLGALAPIYAAGSATLAQCVLFTRRDGTEVALTTFDRNVVVGGRVYLADPGLTMTNMVQTAGLAVDNLEVTLLPDPLVITEADILAGRWNQCGYQLFELDPTNVAAGVNVLHQGTTGNFTMQRGAFRAELRGLEQLLQNGVGWVTQKTCRYRLGSASHRDGWCRKDLTAFTHTGTLTAVTSAQVWVDSASTQADGYFDSGEIEMLDGPAVGLRFLVKTFASDTFTLALPAVIRPEVGDSYRAIRGCDKTRETCRDVFDNLLNFGGEPDGVGMDFLTKPADAYS
jgi:uncharacterized phage protein (TIGR02218 family)